MGRPLRRYCFILAERLGTTVIDLQNKISSQELSEWMAYDLTNDKNWLEDYQKEQERLASKQLDDEARLKAFKRLLGPH